MSNPRRVQQQPAYILHHRPFRDSSQILDILTRDHGKIAVVARGSRGSRSKLAGLLRPFLPLRISWVAKSDLGTLTGAESDGRPAGMRGDALLSAYYVNELLLNFLHRHDPQPEIFALYGQVLEALCGSTEVAVCLREFEIEFLKLLGYALNFEREAGSDQELDPQGNYVYRIESGPVPVDHSTGPMVFTGATLTAIAAGDLENADVLRAANRLLREVVTYHLGGKELQSRKVLLELHRGRIASKEERNPVNE